MIVNNKKKHTGASFIMREGILHLDIPSENRTIVLTTKKKK